MNQALEPPKGAITIEQMLADLVSGGDKLHRLHYVVSQGKRAGEIRMLTCHYGAPRPKVRGVAANEPVVARQPRKKHTESGTLPLTEFGTQTLKTLFIWNIIRYDGKQVL